MTEKGKGTVNEESVKDSVAHILHCLSVRHFLDSLAIVPVNGMFLYDSQVTPQGLVALNPRPQSTLDTSQLLLYQRGG